MTPDTLLALANLTVARKPDRSPTIHPNPLANAATAARALGLARLDATQIGALRELHQTIVQLVDGVLGTRSVIAPATRLASLARASTATIGIDVSDDHGLRPQLRWSDPTPVAALARRVALELAEVDPARLRRCERAECDLVFYDTTRSGTRRWHAESPCGTRERQRRYRSASRIDSPTERH
jgi:predicted RNA-binding Zn ribbon-like protein